VRDPGGPGRPTSRVHPGWYLLAVTTELVDEVTPLWVGSRPVLGVRTDDGIRVYDGSCPHRGAHLGVGGRLLRGHVVCPFHGKGILLGERADRRWCVREFDAIVVGDAVFIRLSATPEHDHGFPQTIREIAGTRAVVEGFTVPVRADPELIVENAFDADHFTAVHEVPRVADMSSRSGPHGELVIEGFFETKPLPWDDPAEGRTRMRFCARAFSPTIVVTELGPPEQAHLVLTGTVPSREGAVARVVYAITPAAAGGAPSPTVLEPLVAGGRKAFRQDVAVWENLDLDATPRFDARDEHVLAFRRFCAGFTTAVRAAR